MSPQEFVAKWADVTLTEKAASQSHFIDLCRLLDQPTPTCRLLDQPTPTEADPTGDFYTFEKGSNKIAGSTEEKRATILVPAAGVKECCF